MTSVGVLTEFVAKPGREASLCEGLLRLVDAARDQPGNLGYDLHQVAQKPWAFYALGDWADEAAAEAGTRAPSVRELVAEHSEVDLAAAPTQYAADMLSRPDSRAERTRPTPGSDQITFFPFFSVRSSEVDAVREELMGAVDKTRAEDGCLDYDLYQSRSDPSVFFYRENWTAQAALDRHMNAPAFHATVRGRIDPRLTVPWSGLTMTMVSRPGPVRTAGA